MAIKVVDLFCGVGGLTCGLKEAGLEVVAGIDLDETCRFAYERNNNAKFIHADISRLPSSKLSALWEKSDVKVLVGCAPCQTFSKQSNKYRARINKATDVRWNLLKRFACFIEDLVPDIVSMENVPELRNFDVFSEFVGRVSKCGYYVSNRVVDCSKYGLPQKRKRLVFLASRYGEIEFPAPEGFPSRNLADAIGALPPLMHGQVCPTDDLHRCAGLSPMNLRRIRQSVPGGTWRDWSENLLPPCYRRKSGRTYGSVYGRMSWDKPSSTITTQFYAYGSGRHGHPDQDRALSLREGAQLQTFPLDYCFFENDENLSISTIVRHIGNAVPVELGRIIGKTIVAHLINFNRG